MNQFPQDSEVFYNFVDSLLPKKVPLDRVRENHRFSAISNEEAIKIIDELYKFSIIAFRIYNNREG